MKFQHLILVGIVLFTCFLIAHPLYLYYYPQEAINTKHLFITELVYITSSTTLIISLFMLRKNIIKRQKLEEKEHEQKELLQAVVDSNPYMVYIKNLDGSYVLVNDKVKNLLGLAAEQESLSEKDTFRTVENKLDLYKSYDKQVVTTRKMVAFEDTYMHKGKLMHFYMLKYPLFDNAGEVKHICGVSVDITELKEAQLKMVEAKEEAIDARKKQEAFMAYITHDIRTPMNGMLGLTDLLLSTELTTDQQQFVNYIRDTANNLLLLVNDILDFSKIQSGKLRISASPFYFRDTVKKAMFPLEKMAVGKNLYLKVNIDEDIPKIVIGDSLRLEQVMTNLVANAIKFTTKGGINVDIRLISADDDKAVIGIDVADSGTGIAADMLDKVFNQFEQVGENANRFYEGTGLGLTIVKQLVELQDGNIEVSSELGKGSKFSIIQPYALAKA